MLRGCARAVVTGSSDECLLEGVEQRYVFTLKVAP